ncbi:MAG: amidase domain-containing protein [Acutalibacteraceae bacterium]
MKTFKKIVCMILVVLMCITSLPFAAVPVSAATQVYGNYRIEVDAFLEKSNYTEYFNATTDDRDDDSSHGGILVYYQASDGSDQKYYLADFRGGSVNTNLTFSATVPGFPYKVEVVHNWATPIPTVVEVKNIRVGLVEFELQPVWSGSLKLESTTKVKVASISTEYGKNEEIYETNDWDSCNINTNYFNWPWTDDDLLWMNGIWSQINGEYQMEVDACIARSGYYENFNASTDDRDNNGSHGGIVVYYITKDGADGKYYFADFKGQPTKIDLTFKATLPGFPYKVEIVHNWGSAFQNPAVEVKNIRVGNVGVGMKTVWSGSLTVRSRTDVIVCAVSSKKGTNEEYHESNFWDNCSISTTHFDWPWPNGGLYYIYNATAAVEWAKDHLYDTWSSLYGQGYWEKGTGDCANFVSQCIYMGGLNQTADWNHSGYKNHWSLKSDGSWVRASQLHDYVVSLGGISIKNPSASQITPGDLIFYKMNPGTSGFSHSAIVIDVSGGQVTVAAHTTEYKCYQSTNWHLGFQDEGTYLVKMNGATCTDQPVRDFDVYTAGSNSRVYYNTSESSGSPFKFYSGEYVHVYETKTVNGVQWGYTCGYSGDVYDGFSYGWVKLNTLNYQTHVKTGPYSHIMGNWYTKVYPSCSARGVEERICSRCGYTEQRYMALGGEHMNLVSATCTSPAYCTACGQIIGNALGHNMSEWTDITSADCLNKGEQKRTCSRCGYQQKQSVDALGHDYQAIVDIPTCVTDGTTTYRCTRCGDTYIDGSEWTGWTTDYDEQYFADSLIPSSMYESRTEYRYRTKSETSSDEWSDWSDWSTDEQIASDTVQVETRTTYRVKQAALGHSWNAPGVTVAPTCHEEGYTLFTCQRCGVTKKENIVEAYGDLWSEWYLTSAEDATPRVYRRDCVRGCGCNCGCHEIKIEECIYEAKSVVAPTCSEQGYTVFECTLHNETYNGEYTDALGHESDENWFVTKAPTCDESGEEQCKCVRNDDGVTCSQTYTRAIESVGHSLTKTEAVAASCEKDGNSEYYTCSKCMRFFSDSSADSEIAVNSWVIEKTGHFNDDVWVTEIEAACGVTGRKVRYCQNDWCDISEPCQLACGNETSHHYVIEEAEIEQFQPEWELVKHVDPTCISDGYDEYTCTLCKYTDKAHGYSDEIACLGHDFEEEATYEATCTEDGYAVMKCKRGDAVYEVYTDAKTGHAKSPLDEDYDESTDQMELVSSVANICGSGTVDTYRCTHIDANTSLRCDYQVVIGDEQDHTLGDYIIDLAPTCIDDGLQHKECINEGCTYKTQPEAIPAIGHDYQFNCTVSATCSTPGYDYYICANDNSHTNQKNYTDPIGHEADNNWVQTKAPTCSAEGEEQCKCVRHDNGMTCNKIYTRAIAIDPEAHDWGDGVIDPVSTCKDYGTKTYICSLNGEHKKTELVALDETNHAGGTYLKNDKAATCTVDGYSGDTYCSGCNVKLSDGETIPALGHEADNNWVQTKAPTCSEEGEEQCKCVRHDNGETCDKIYTRAVAIDPEAHDWDDGVIDPISTCKDHGTKTYTCKLNDEHKKTELVALDGTNHAGGIYIKDDKAPTCTVEGYIGDTYCSGCDVKLSDGEAIPALGHEPDNNWVKTKAPTCSTEGEEQCKCVRYDDGVTCDKTFIRPVPIDPEAHNWDEGVIDPVSTCKDHGTKTYTCKLNGEHKKTESVPLDGNNHDGGTYIKDDKAATCIVEGYTGDTYCSGCNIKLSDGEVISALGHDMGSWSSNDNSTHTRSCQRENCDYEETVACTFGEWEEIKAATCTVDGEKARTCTVCGYVDKDTISALGHEADNNWVQTKAPTCSAEGEEQCKCVRHDNGVTCDKIYTRPVGIDPEAHNWDGGIIDPVSTCKDHGTKTYTCKLNSEHKKTESVPLDSNNHDGGTYIKDDKAANCTVQGYTGDTYCSGCDAKLSDGEIIPALGHEPDNNWVETKASTYDEEGEEQCKCVRHDNGVTCDEVYTRPLPVLTRPSDDNDYIDTEKTVDYNPSTGEATIRLIASSKGKTVTTKSRTPLDIVLVLDQSGSMAGGLEEKLKDATEKFYDAIYKDAVENGIDHRIAMVGFAMQNQYNYGNEFYQYLNTEVLTTGGEPIRYNSLPTKEMNQVYKNALVYVNVGGELNPVITLAKDNIGSKGATAADLGLDMACQIFSQNENDGSRKRIVLFMTDGVPTYKSDYMAETAENAIAKADELKDIYDADLYSVGVLSGNEASKAKSFLNNIASSKADGTKMYIDCTDAGKLVDEFENIATESTTTTTDFNDIMLVDTISSAFILTELQEKALRKNAVEQFGISNDDITINRYSDGTTQIMIQHITPKMIANGSDVSFVVDFSFAVTANEKALVQGSFETNTDNAGVIIGEGDVYENNFIAPSADVENADGVVYFTVNGIVYHAVRVHSGDELKQPEFTLEGKYSFSGWDIPDEVVFDGGKLIIDATLTQEEYTVTWIMDNETQVDTYFAGDIISVPKVDVNAKNEEFLCWDKTVPTVMPGENLIFTATYGQHEHEYTQTILVKASCGVEGKIQYTCSCSDTYIETVPALSHQWVTRTTSSDGSEKAYSYIRCSNCGESPDSSLTYQVTGKVKKKSISYNLQLIDATGVSIQPDGTIKISLPIPEDMRSASNIQVFREESDGSKTNLNGVIEGSYITFVTTHFSPYTLEATYDCESSGNHIDDNGDGKCDICDSSLIPDIPDEPSDPSAGCTHLCHKGGFAGFIWKIINLFNRLFKVNRYCSCGMAHY